MVLYPVFGTSVSPAMYLGSLGLVTLAQKEIARFTVIEFGPSQFGESKKLVKTVAAAVEKVE